MDLHYFKDHVYEELEGAKDYIERAIESKISHPAWCKTFVAMADAEADHAGNLMKMMETYIREMSKEEMKMAHKTVESSTAATSSLMSASAMSSTPSTASHSPEDVYTECMKHFGEVMTYVNNMKRGLY